MPRSRTARLIMLLALAATAALSIGAATVFAADSQVDITEANSKYSFDPGTSQVTVGSTVTWQNKSDAPHTVTSDDGGGPLDGQIAANDGSFEFTFDTAGTFAYHCEIHDYMKGVVEVVEAGSSGGEPTQPPTDTVTSGSAGDSGSAPLPLVVGFGIAGLAGVFLARRRLAAIRVTRQ